MNPNTFAGFNLDDVFRQEEERLRKLHAGAGKKPKAKPRMECPPKSEPVIVVPSVSYHNLEFEPVAPRKGNDKELLYFDKSLERLRTAGYERHPSPAEAFSLIIDGLEGKLTGSLAGVKDDMLSSYGEWLSLVFKREGNILHCYEDPENVIRTGNTYDCSGMTFRRETPFQIKGLKSEDYIPIKTVNKKSPALVSYLWNKPFAQLPGEIQKNAGIWVPADGAAWPVGRDNFSSGYYVNGYSCSIRASRGVRSSSAKKSP